MSTTSPPPSPSTLDAAENCINFWSTTTSSLFDDPEDVDKYFQSVHHLLSHRPSPENTLNLALDRLDDEFRRLLATRATALDLNATLDLSSLSLAPQHIEFPFDEDSNDIMTVVSFAEGHGRSASCRSTNSIRELELIPPETLQDLKNVADTMSAAGRGQDCVQSYVEVRRTAVEESMERLGVENLSIGEVQRLEWDVVEAKVKNWVRATRICIRIVFASEKYLCESIFGDQEDGAFVETVKGAAKRLFGFAEAVSIGRRAPEKLFKVIDLHDAVSELMSDVGFVFGGNSGESVCGQVREIVVRLGEAIRGIFSEFENAVMREASRGVVPGGTIHPLTRYVMNYLSLISDYKATLVELIVTRPSVNGRVPGEENSSVGAALLSGIDLPELESFTPLASHLIWIIAVLQHNLDNKSTFYKDGALSHLFLMNNVHYIVSKIKGSVELREMIGDDYLRKLTVKYTQEATSYKRASWPKVLHCLRDEGIHVSGSFSSGISKSTLRERFRSFNATFDEVHRTQSAWSVPDQNLSDDLRISISASLLPAYRSFLGRFQQHIESGRHPENYIKYTVEDLEMALYDFFVGVPQSSLTRRRTH